MQFVLNDKTYTEVDFATMSITELSALMVDVQTEIHSIAIEKQRLCTLPKNKKDGKTLSKVRKLNERLINLQDCTNRLSVLRKEKRDVQSRERDWFRQFYQVAQCSVRKGLFEKIESEVTAQLGYGRL